MILIKRLKNFRHRKTIRKMLGAGPHLLLAGVVIEGLTVIFHQSVSLPIRLNPQSRIALTILCGTICMAGLVWIRRFLVSIAVNLSNGRNQLMTEGPFAYVRHPLYANYMMTLPPLLIIWFADLMFFIPWIFIIIVAHHVVIIEERSLVDVFGDAYEEYRRSVPALIPIKGAVGKPLRKGRQA